MRYFILLLIVTAMAFTACSTKTNPYIKYNRVILEYNTHYSNDTLELAITFPGDIELSTDSIPQYRKRINSAKTDLKRIRAKEVLAHGYTTTAPHYQLLLAIDKKPFKKKKKKVNTPDEEPKIVSFQRQLDDQYILLVGSSSAEAMDNMASDLSGIMKSIKHGDLYEQKQPKSPMQIALDELNSEEKQNYFTAILGLQDKKGNYSTKNEKFAYQQSYLTAASMVSGSPDFDSIETAYEEPRRMDLTDYDDSGDHGEVAIQKILSMADNQKVVMLNELHWDRRHRMQILELLPEFKELGFNYLAMEAVWDQDSLLNKRGYPIKSTGFYSLEPTMGQIIRRALQLGFKVVGYDVTGNDREIRQATNLYNRTLKEDPDARVLVHAGVGHIHEIMDGRKVNMAAQLKKKYDINPLTIDQSKLGMIPTILDEYEKILLSNEGINKYDDPGLQTDYYLGTRKPEEYILQEGPLKSVQIGEINNAEIMNESQVMTQVFFLNEYTESGDSAIPLYNNWGLKTAYQLSPGDYYWRVINAYGDVLQEEQLNVE